MDITPDLQAESRRNAGDPLPANWAKPSRWAQRLAANSTALGIAWKGLPLPVRILGSGGAIYLAARFGVPHEWFEAVLKF